MHGSLGLREQSVASGPRGRQDRQLAVVSWLMILGGFVRAIQAAKIVQEADI